MIELAEVQTKIYERLTTFAPLISLVPSNKIRNHIPQDEPLPYIRFRVQADQWDNKTTNGYELKLILDIWDNSHGDLLVLQIHDQIRACFTNYILPLTSGINIVVNFTNVNTFIEPDGQTHHGVVSIRFLLSE